MKRNFLFVLGSILIVTLIAAGVGYAWSSRSSDVGSAIATDMLNVGKYHVVGTSMEPTIKYGDWLEVDSRPASVLPGDIILFRSPQDRSLIYCRRVVGVGGDRVVMKYYSNVKVTTVMRANLTVSLVFPAGVVPDGNAYGEFTTTVPAQSYYVVGDNTAPGGSYDSDEWGTVPANDLLGVVMSRTSPDPRIFSH